MLMSDLQSKDIIDTKNGVRLGRIVDIDVDDGGMINYLIVEPFKMIRKFNNSDYKVSFKNIRTIGNDVILVELD